MTANHHPTTRELTLSRLPGVQPNGAAMRAVFSERELRENELHLETVNIAGWPAVIVYGMRGGARPPDWLDDFRTTAGISAQLHATRPAAAVLIALDGAVYAFSYGDGHHLIPREHKEPSFGRRFAARAGENGTVATVNRRPMDVAGRYESTRITRGGPVSSYGVHQERDVVTGFRVRCALAELTHYQDTGRAPYVDGADEVRTRLGVAPSDLVNDIRLIAEIEESAEPNGDLAKFEALSEVRDPDESAALWELFAEAVRTSELDLAIAPPDEALEALERAGSFQTHIITTCSLLEGCDPANLLDHLRNRLAHIRAGNVVEGLRKGWIKLYRDPGGRHEIGKYTKLLDWVEATVNQGFEIYVLRHGRWYHYGAAYKEAADQAVREALERGAHRELPPWKKSKRGETITEYDYNTSLHNPANGSLCMDRDLARTPVHWGKGIELCDVFGPDDALIHVKRASSAAPLSHLFNQVRSAFESLAYESAAREKFVNRVLELDPDRRITQPFQPQKVVFAIQLTHHAEVSEDTLYPLAQVELYRAVTALERQNIRVELVGIPHGA